MGMAPVFMMFMMLMIMFCQLQVDIDIRGLNAIFTDIVDLHHIRIPQRQFLQFRPQILLRYPRLQERP